MARTYIPEEPSPYYPPRARWYSPVLDIGNAVRRRLALERLAFSLPDEARISHLIAGFLVPGLAVYFRGPQLWGKVAMASSALLALVFIVWLGYPVANLAFGLMISLHTTGFVYYCGPLLRDETVFRRLVFTFLVLIGIGFALYLPARNFIQNHWVTPFRLYGHVVVAQRSFQARQIVRGDWVAYTFNEEATGANYHGGVVQLQSGMNLGPVLGVAGDQVVFSTNSFSVNGVSHPRLAHMPASGELVVPEKHWFIWPNLDISGYGDVGEARVSGALMGLSDVDRSQFFGKPLQHWFWRKQVLP